MRIYLIISCSLLGAFLGSGSAIASEKLPVVRVNATTQAWDFVRPWSKKSPVTRRATGAVLAGGRVLVSSEMVANSTYLEFEVPEGGKKVPARVETVNYEANLALLKTDDPEFMKGIPHFELAESQIGDDLTIYQLENSGRPLFTNGPLTTAEVAPYLIEGSFLVYRVTIPLQTRDNGFSLPVLNKGKLTGMLMTFDNQSNNGNIIPAPVIEHFIKDFDDAKYGGFPRGGFMFSPLRDPQLRNYCKLPPEVTGGIYITETVKGGAMDLAGLQRGDVLLKVESFEVDQDGNYLDERYGKIPVGHVFSVKHYSGDSVKVEAMRNGQRVSLDVTLVPRKPTQTTSDPYIIDQAPKFYILGGLVIQELSRQYLKDLSPDGQGHSPDRLAYYDRYQNELFREGPSKIVFLSFVLPIPDTVGFEELNHLVIKSINDFELQDLGDVPKALAKAQNGFHKIQFLDDPKTIYLDAQAVGKNEALLKRQYNIPVLKRLE